MSLGLPATSGMGTEGEAVRGFSLSVIERITFANLVILSSSSGLKLEVGRVHNEGCRLALWDNTSSFWLIDLYLIKL